MTNPIKVNGKPITGNDYRRLRHALAGEPPETFNPNGRGCTFTRKKLARRLGVSPSTVGRWERDQQTPQNEALRAKITRLFGKHWSELA